LHLARRCGWRVARWSRFPSRRLPEVLKQSILASPMAFRTLVEDASLSDHQMQQCRLGHLGAFARPAGRLSLPTADRLTARHTASRRRS
jgi:hypothetical protein